MQSERSLSMVQPIGEPVTVKVPGPTGVVAGATGEMQMTGVADTTNADNTSADNTNLAHRLDVLGWGVFFLMTGVLMLFPSLPEGTWLVGLGALMLGLAAVRVGLGLAFEWFGVILGIGALVAGFGTIAGVYIPVFALFLVACGVALIAGVVSKGRTER
jgi:hypothetical protein